VLVIALILKFIDSFRKFEGIQLLTTGGPGIASTTLNLHIYVTGLTLRPSCLRGRPSASS